MFAEQGCAVWDADEAVRRLYGKNGSAVAKIASVFPDAVRDDVVSKDVLRHILSEDPSALKKIEEIVHPLVAEDRLAFLETSTADITVLDIPLLFETGSDALMDAVVCVSVPADIQEERVMARGTMTSEQFHQIRSKQMPNAEKEERADFVIVTDTVEHARAQVQTILKHIRSGLEDA